MKKIICLMLAIVMIFSFSACGDNSKENEVIKPENEVVELSASTLVELAEAFLSENGAVYQDCIDRICNKNYKYQAEVIKVDNTHRVDGSDAYSNDDPALESRDILVFSVDIDAYDQVEVLKTLKEGDIVEFEGELVYANASNFYGLRIRLDFRFDNVVITSVNGVAI